MSNLTIEGRPRGEDLGQSKTVLVDPLFDQLFILLALLGKRKLL